MSTKTSFQGVYPILNTPFHDDGSLDMDSQLRLVDYLLEAGAHGLGLFGNASEGYALSSAERRLLMEAIVTACRWPRALDRQFGHTGTDVAVETRSRLGTWARRRSWCCRHTI